MDLTIASIPTNAEYSTTMEEPPMETAIRIEILDESGLENFVSHWTRLAAATADARLGKADFRAAVSLYGEVVYAATGLLTLNPVRIGGLPCDCDLSFCILPPVIPLKHEGMNQRPILTTAAVTLSAIYANAIHAPQEGLPDASFWEGWLPLNVCEELYVGLDWARLMDMGIQVSILFEESLNKKLVITTPLATHSCLSSSMQSEDWNDRPLEKSQSYRLSSSLMHSFEINNDACLDQRQPLRSSSLEQTIRLPSELGTTAQIPHTSPLDSSATMRKMANAAYASSRPYPSTSSSTPIIPAPRAPSPETPMPITSARLAGIISTNEMRDIAATSRERALQDENDYLRNELACCREENASLRRQHEEDRRRVQDKLMELDKEVRERWQARVVELEREIAHLRGIAGIGNIHPVTPSIVASPQPVQRVPDRAHGFGAGHRGMPVAGQVPVAQPFVPNRNVREAENLVTPENIKRSDMIMPSWTPPGIGSPPTASFDCMHPVSVAPPGLAHKRMADGQWQHNIAMQQPEAASNSTNNARSISYPWHSQPNLQSRPGVSSGIGLQPPIGLNVPRLRFPTAMGPQAFNVSPSAGDVSMHSDRMSDQMSHETPTQLQGKFTPTRQVVRGRDDREGNSPNSEGFEGRSSNSRPPSPPRPQQPPPPRPQPNHSPAVPNRMAWQTPRSYENAKKRSHSLEMQRDRTEIDTFFQDFESTRLVTTRIPESVLENGHEDVVEKNTSSERHNALAPCRSRSDPTLPHLDTHDHVGFNGFLNSFNGIYNKVYGAIQGKGAFEPSKSRHL